MLPGTCSMLSIDLPWHYYLQAMLHTIYISDSTYSSSTQLSHFPSAVCVCVCAYAYVCICIVSHDWKCHGFYKMLIEKRLINSKITLKPELYLMYFGAK